MGRLLSTRTAVLWVLSALSFVACMGGVGEMALGAVPQGAAVASVSVSPSSATLTVIGQAQQFTATASDSAGSPVAGITFTWSSADTTVVTVDTTGVAHAVGNGTAGVSATAEGVSGTATVTVSLPAGVATARQRLRGF
jgi:hypothetical protein